MRLFSFLALCLCCALAAGVARADLAQDVGKLMKQGDKTQAMREIERALAADPDDAQARFLKGVALMEAGKNEEAAAIFTKLNEDRPELPEPYNNLAVIYARQKQYDKAKTALEMAIRTHPAYATALENLGDVYARMASEAYGRALQINAGNKNAQLKLSAIKSLIGAPAPAPAASAPAAAGARKAEARPATPATVPESSAAAKEAATTEVKRAIDEWLAAWSNKDVSAYLSCYAHDFQTPGGMTRADWEAERTRRIDKPDAIRVSYDNLQIQANGDEASARFRQHYVSGALKADAEKTLTLRRVDGRWLIRQERSGQ